jgi:hypothetical protein
MFYPSDMQQQAWEYHFLKLSGLPSEDRETLNEFGRAYWELVAVVDTGASGGNAIFKRPLIQASAWDTPAQRTDSPAIDD